MTKLVRMRYTLARRVVQIGVLLAFIGTAHWGWKLAGRPLLAGNLSAASLVGVPLADPFALLQILASRHPVATEGLLGAAIVLIVYALLGCVFCAWVCPMNMVTDAAAWMRQKLGVTADLNINPAMRYWIMGLALLLSLVTGVAAFEWVSPVSMLHRELIFGAGLGLSVAAAIFLLDAFVIRSGWCGRLCPLGAFWSLAGRAAQLRIRFDDASCSRCDQCVDVCPEPQVLRFDRMATRGFIDAGACSNCARCIVACPEDSLRLGWRSGSLGHKNSQFEKERSS